MKTRALRIILCVIILIPLLPGVPFADDKEVSILVDGLPLDGKGIMVGEEIYVPAWILENYGRTKLKWRSGTSILEINTYKPDEVTRKMEGTLSVRIGFYSDAEGFVMGRNLRMYILNENPRNFRFEGGIPVDRRAHDSTVSSLQPINEWVARYLALSPHERNYKEGWNIISRMDRETILELNNTVVNYENLYREYYYDLLSTLVIEKDRIINETATITEESKKIKIFRLVTDEEGKGKITLPNGTHFVFCRMYLRGNLILWNLPVTIRGTDITLELTNRNTTYSK